MEEGMTQRLLLLGLTIALPLAFPSGARGVTVQGVVVHNVPYLIAFRPINTHQEPYLGQMHLNFNNGIISGNYTDISIRPGSPFANAQNIPVSGGVDPQHLTLIIRHVTFRGRMNGTAMSGSTTIHGGRFAFEAQQGSPGSGRER
jgi:hypothetical protein